MNKIQQFLLGAGILATSGFFVTPALAQVKLPADAYPTIVAPHKQAVNFRERTLCYDITANVDFEAKSNVDWATVRKTDDGSVYVHLDVNPTGETRKGEIVFYNAANNLTETLTITQTKNEDVNDIPEDNKVAVSSATANIAQGGAGANLTIDGNYSTIYHSPYSGGTPTPSISEQNPAILTYNFQDVERIDYLKYTPRPGNSGSNGNFDNVEVYVKCEGDADFKLYGKYKWNGSSAPSTVDFKDGLLKPVAIQVKVTSGTGNFASCAEMEFFTINEARANIFSIFADDVCSKLKEGTTQADIDALEDDFARNLAQQIFDKKYDTNYRVADYQAFLDPAILSAQWNCPGKKYNQIEGITGINITPGKHAVIVSGIPEGETVNLTVYAWFSKDLALVDNEWKGAGPSASTFGLKNGINIINYTQENNKDGLAYICYNTQNDPKTLANVKVHFVNGQINGYLSEDKTNEEMLAICKNAKNTCMDVKAKKAHAVWTANGLRDYCKAVDGKIGYRQYMNVLDSLVQWEHDILGFTKYGREPENTTFAYVNYTYYMFQGGLGVSFKYDTESRVLNCNTIMNHDSDAIWGLSHEWGHQHQMTPYFCWAGLAEVSNNMNSYYNTMKMGYNYERGSWDEAREMFKADTASNYTILYDKYDTYCITRRGKAYSVRDNYKYSQKLYDLCTEMGTYNLQAPVSEYNGSFPYEVYRQNTTIPSVADNKLKAVSIMERGVGDILAPFILLFNYQWFEANQHDFYPDLYEALRQTDDANGSQIEKKGGVDKYELIASAQNNNKNGKLAQLKADYPNSCWVTDDYITESHCGQFENCAPYIFNFIRKASRLAGYNLVPYFEQWGFIRAIALRIGDYGEKHILITEEMYNEFIKDMDALVESGELKAMPDGMLNKMMNQRHINMPNDKLFNTPVIPN